MKNKKNVLRIEDLSYSYKDDMGERKILNGREGFPEKVTF